MSTTVTFCVTVVKLPVASVIVHVTTVVPIGKLAGASLTIEAIVQLSVASGVPRLTPVASQKLFVFTVTCAGAVASGAT